MPGFSAALTDTAASNGSFVFSGGIRSLTDSNGSSDSLTSYSNIGTTVGWKSTDTAGTVNVSGSGNSIASFPGSAAIRSATSHITGKFYFEVTVTGTLDAEGPIIGLCSSAFNIFGNPGQDSPPDSIGFYPGDTSQEVILNNVFYNAGFASSPLVSGETVYVCADITNHAYYFLSPELIALYGANGWNGLSTADPSNGVGGITQNFSTASYIVGRTDIAGMTLTLNSGQTTFQRAPPTGFVAWDSAVSISTSLVDAAISSEGLAAALSVARSLTDSVSSTDNLTAILGAAPVLNDSIGNSDASTVSLNAFGSRADTGVLSEALAGTAFGLLLQDSAAAVDTLTPVIGLNATRSESVASSDLLQINAASLNIADTVTVGETLSGPVAASVALADNAVTTDGLLFGGFGFVLADSAASSDVRATNFGLTSTFTDSTSSSDSYPIVTVGLFVADSVGNSDTLSTPAVTLSLLDNAAVVDTLAISASGSFFGALADTIVSFAGPVFQAIGLFLADAVTPTDFASATNVTNASRGDSAVSSDGVAIRAVAQIVTETTSSGDSFIGLGSGQTVVLSDTASTASDPVLAAATLLLTNQASSDDSLIALGAAASLVVSETATTTDQTGNSGSVSAAVLIDGVATTTALVSVFNLSPVFADSIDNTDVSTATANPAATLTDANGTADIAAVSGDFINALADTLSSTDNLQTPNTALSFGDSSISLSQLFGLAQFPLTVGNTTGISDSLAAIFGEVTDFSDTLLSDDAFNGTFAVNFSFNLNDQVHLSDTYPSAADASGPDVTVYPIPTGGAVRISIPGYFNPPIGVTSMRIQRAVLGLTGLSPFTLIYSGSLCAEFIDVGDGLPGPLDPRTAYVWQVIDAGGITQTPPVTPVSSLLSTVDGLTPLLIRLLQGSLNNTVLPDGAQKARIVTKMPMNGWMAMPFIVICLELIQQTDVALGEAVVLPTQDNNWTLFADAKRVWRISVMSQDAEERDFYRDSLLDIFRVLKATAFPSIGLNVRHSFQAVSYTAAKEWEGQSPGFYGADLMLEIDGIFPSAVLTHYPVILHVESDPTVKPYDFTVELA